MPRWNAKLVLVALAALAQLGPALAQSSGTERLFIAFAEDATIAQKQWWEGQIEYDDSVADTYDAWILRGVVAFQPWANVELGGRAGFGSTDTGGTLLEDGSGATDLDVWGKYLFGDVAKDTVFALGALATVPTGDDAVGLGDDSFGIAGFGALRHRLERFTIAVNAGLRANEDGRKFGVELQGDTALFLGGAVIWPLSDEVTFVGEVRYEGERFKESDKDTRVLGGINWRLFNTGIARAAVATGLSDGSPDFQLLVGYAAQF